MFGKKRGAGRDGAVTETFIGEGTRIEGSVTVGGSLRVEGEIIGEIVAEGDVLVAASGRVDGDVTARNIVVGGRVAGAVKASSGLELLAGGHVVGDAEMKTLVVEEGGMLEGSSRMGSGEESVEPIRLDPVG